MVYRILTNLGKGGSPFKAPKTPLTAFPVIRSVCLRKATLVAFDNQHDSVFARKSAIAYGKIFWCVTEDILHPDDLAAAKVFAEKSAGNLNAGCLSANF